MEKVKKTKNTIKSSRWEAVKKWIYDHRFFIYAFFIPVLIMALAYGFFDVYPIGNLLGASFENRSIKHDGSVLVLDLNGQYVYYYEAIRDAIWGHGSILYNWSRNLSGEFIGIIGYYLASPFTWIVILLPRTMLLESLLIMQLAKLGTIGVTFSYYLQKSKKIKPINSIIFSTLFALSAYAVIQLMDPMWIDGLILMPLIMLGIEKLVDKEQKANYIIPLAIMFVANFYIGFMLAIFCVIYFLYYTFLGTEKEHVTTSEIVKTCIRFGYCSIIAGMCSAFLVIPVYRALTLGKFDFSTPDYSIAVQFSSIDILSKLLPSSYDTVRNEGLPEIYCGTLTILMIPLFYFNTKISRRNKIGYSLILAVLFFSMYIKPVDMMWHGGQVPNWLPYRYSFMMSCILLVMAAQAFENLDGIKSSHIGGTFAGVLAYLLLAEKVFKYENIDVLSGIWFTAGCVLCFAILVSAYKENLTSKAVPITIMVLVSGELLISTFDTIKDINTDVIYSMRSSYYNYIESGRAAVRQIEQDDDGLFRSEKVAKSGSLSRTVNDDMAFGLKGITHSSSVMNAKIIDTIGKLGYISTGHYTRYEGNTPLSDSLLGIKYVLDSNASGVSDMYNYQKSTITEHDDGSSTQLDIYQNPYALPIGYMVDDDIANVYIEDTVNPFMNQNALMSAMIGEQKEYFKRMEYTQDPVYSNITVENAGAVNKYTATPGVDSTIDFYMQAKTNDNVYLYFPTTYEKQVNLWKGIWNSSESNFDFSFFDYYFENADYSIKRLGRFEPNQSFALRVTVAKEDTYMSDQLFYSFDEALFKQDIEKLKQQAWNITKWSETHIEGTVSADNNQIFFTSIPYEDGWKVKVDGKKAEIIPLANKSFIGVRVAPGDHEIEMSFFPSGMPVGILLSVIGIGFVVVFIIADKNKGFRFGTKKKTTATSKA